MSFAYTPKELHLIDTANDYIVSICSLESSDDWKNFSNDENIPELHDATKYCFKKCSLPGASCSANSDQSMEQKLKKFNIALAIGTIMIKKGIAIN